MTDKNSAVRGLIGAFHSSNLVALGERHWAREDSAFRLRLIRDPAFAQAVDDIVVEFANPLYQDLLDRFVNGGAVPPTELSRVWRDTTQPGAWDSPVYEEFLRAVRQLNAGLSGTRRLRILAGDAPMDWSVTPPQFQPEDIDKRDSYAASVIEREVLNRSRKALVLFGSGHLYRNRTGTVVELFRNNPRARWFITVPFGGPGLPSALAEEEASEASPAFIVLGRSPVGDLFANQLLETGTQRVQVVDGKPVLVDGKPVLAPVEVFDPSVKVREVADACIYFGSAQSTTVRPPVGLYSSTEYGKEMLRRRAIVFNLR